MTVPAAGNPDDVLDLVGPGADLVLGMANGEASAAVDALEREHLVLEDVRLHQMHALRPRPHIDGRCGDHLRHVSYFLTGATRDAYHAGECAFVPTDFSALPRLLLEHVAPSLVLVAASPPDAAGWCTLGTQADYSAALIGRVPFFVEVNAQMPRTAGAHRIRLADCAGWYAVDRPLAEPTHRAPDDRDHAIAAAVVERIPDGATIQLGVGSVPDAVCVALAGHRDLGIHSELVGDGVMDLIRSGVVTGARKRERPGVAVATFALGSQRLYRWLDGEPRVEFLPVDEVNDPRRIAREPGLVSVNATTEVDLYGQCASETIAGRQYSGSGGQGDFARGSVWSEHGEAFVVLHATTSSGRSRIRATLTPGSVVTTSRNAVDHVVTEWGVASLRGRTLAERAAALIAIAHPEHREALTVDARAAGLLPCGARGVKPMR